MKTEDERRTDPAVSRAARAMVRARWKKTTPEERKATMAVVGAARTPEQMRQGGRPRTKLRCPCGAMTRKRAKQRNHKCKKQAE